VEEEASGQEGRGTVSTKIYNGYRIDKCSLSELQAFCMRLRDRMEQVYEMLYASKVMKEAVDIIDEGALLNAGLYVRRDIDKEVLRAIDNPKSSPLWSAMWMVHERSNKIKETMKRDTAYDFDCQITFIPKKDKILAMIFTEQRLLEEVFSGHLSIAAPRQVHKYGYWDNSDKPDCVSEEEWDKRAQDWDDVYITAMSGFSVQCTPVYLPMLQWDALFRKAQKPTYKERVDRHVFNLMLKRYAEEDGDAEHKASGWWRLIEGTKEWMDGSGWRQRVRCEIAVEAVLKEITLESLTAEVPQGGSDGTDR